MVTTFIPSRSLDDEDDDDDKGVGSSIPSGTVSSVVSVFTPSQSRRRALVRVARNQSGREALLQLIQSVSLLLYSLAPCRARRRQLHLISESISTLRKFMLVGRWLVEGSNAIQDQLEHSTKNMKIRDVNGFEVEKVESETEKGDGNISSEEEEEATAEESQKEAVSAWRQALQDGVGSISEYFGIGAETCDLLAFFGGSGMLWRVVGGKLASRQRKGLERVAVFMGFLSLLFALLHLQHLRARQSRHLRTANSQLLRATDRVMDTDAKILLQGHRLLPEQALSNDTVPRTVTKSDKVEPLPIEKTLRKTERRVFLEKKKLDHLKLERTAIRSELFFMFIELMWPHQDHSRIEGYTGIVASLCNISRLAGESRWQL